jgi:ComF family protein
MFFIQLLLTGKRVLFFLQNFIFPQFCALCDVLLEDEMLLCSSCVRVFQPVVSKKIGITKKHHFVLHAFSLYKNECKPLVHAKYYGNQALFYDLGYLVAQHIEKSTLLFDVIVPIPLHGTRYAWRGFNQSETIAKAIAHRTGKPVIQALKRTKITKYQSHLSKDLRQENVKSAFSISLSIAEFEQYKNARILLVDDLYTTGATIQEAVCELKRYGMKSIEVFVVFRGQ